MANYTYSYDNAGTPLAYGDWGFVAGCWRNMGNEIICKTESGENLPVEVKEKLIEMLLKQEKNSPKYNAIRNSAGGYEIILSDSYNNQGDIICWGNLAECQNAIEKDKEK